MRRAAVSPRYSAHLRTRRELYIGYSLHPAQSPPLSYPAWGLASLFFASALTPRRISAPSLMSRVGFGAIFTGAGYILSCGDAYNGSGITTAWSLAYMLFHLRNAITTQRSPVTLGLAAATTAAASLYGTEYFVLQDSHSCARERLNPFRAERSRHLCPTTTSND
ncbi:hypothetical protein FOMPIDRAFT_1121729 [Fomitopsis schrenkii]|uniref:Uncharacterized protein n=1 Tax=Fomitopsis schrenkii TaxID=2126942 RepID=S8E8B8_FOMSC|nr:hypothetical protein FOMPIDRAFT_1121729 [Fomitopsis schrenkii]